MEGPPLVDLLDHVGRLRAHQQRHGRVDVLVVHVVGGLGALGCAHAWGASVGTCTSERSGEEARGEAQGASAVGGAAWGVRLP